jgi:hypothetical protein
MFSSQMEHLEPFLYNQGLFPMLKTIENVNEMVQIKISKYGFNPLIMLIWPILKEIQFLSDHHYSGQVITP